MEGTAHTDSADAGRRWRRLWVPVLLGWVLGTALQILQPTLWSGGTYGALALAAVLLLGAHRREGWRGLLAVLAAAALLAFALTGARALERAGRTLAPTLDGELVQAEWQVQALPRLSETGVQVAAQVLHAQRPDGAAVPAPQALRIFWVRPPESLPRLLPGQIWRGTLRLRAPTGLANPHGFDAEAWAWREGIAANATVLATPAAPQLVGDEAWRHPVERARTLVRDAILERLPPATTGAVAGLIAALVTGDQGAIAAADWAVIRATGIAHLVAISGLHVTLFAYVAAWVVGLLWQGIARRYPAWLLRWPVPVAAGLGGLVLATGYALFAGWGVPAQRTVTMLAVLVGLQLSGRRWPWPVTWLLAMAVALVLDPWALLQPGFWLSFVAVAVLFGQGQVPVVTGLGWARWRQEAWTLLRVQARLTVALAPLTLLLFGQVSLAGLLANLVAIPVMTWVLTPLALAGVVWPWLWEVAAAVAQPLWRLLQAMAAWPLAVWERPALPLLLAVLACVGALLLVWRAPWRWRLWGALLLWPALAYQAPGPAPGRFEVVLPDVGQGSAAIVRTARHTLLFDTGPAWRSRGNAAERVLLPWLRALGATPDAIVVSHDDIDHAGGMATLASAYPAARWWASFDPGALLPAAVQPCAAGTHWEWDGVRFEFLHPPSPDWEPPPGGGDNARSCVLRVGEGEQAALFTGDIRVEEEEALIARQPGLRTGLLVAAHHGSHTSTGAAWLDQLRPRAIVVQAGRRNRYGHPHRVVIERIEARAIPWVNTATCGAAIWRSDAPAELRCERWRERHYWQQLDRAASSPG